MLGRADGGSAEPLENTLRVSKFDMSTIVTRGEEIDKIVAKANPSRVIVEIKLVRFLQQVHVKSSCCYT